LICTSACARRRESSTLSRYRKTMGIRNADVVQALHDRGSQRHRRQLSTASPIPPVDSPVGDWGNPSFGGAPFVSPEVKLLTAETSGTDGGVPRSSGRKGKPDDAFEDLHHRQLREIVQRVRTESRLQIYSVLRERIVRKPVYETAGSCPTSSKTTAWVVADEVAAPLVDRDTAWRIAAKRILQTLRKNCGRAPLSPSQQKRVSGWPLQIRSLS